MTYHYNGVDYALEFVHDIPISHPRLGSRRGTDLFVRGPSNHIHLSSQVIYNPEKVWSREGVRQAAIEKLRSHPGLLPEEYALIRRAYFLRPRKTAQARKRGRAYAQELKAMIHNGDLPHDVREAAQFLYAYRIAKANLPSLIRVQSKTRP